jgi:uncharacterized damage-inducible protein DinB
MAEPLVDLFRHNTWANMRLLDACARLTDEELGATVEGTYGSIDLTLVHIEDAQEAYLQRLTGERFASELDETVFPGMEEIRTRLTRSNEELERFAAGDGPGRLIEWTRDGFDRTMPASLFLVQTVNHSTEHRSQILTILTQTGHEPPELDGWSFAEATGAFRERPSGS